jgi:glycosyltransferase involved in cell wall biosynthesis
MRIAHVATSISLSQIVLNQMIFQREEGHEVFALCPEDDWTVSLRNNGIRVFKVPFLRHRLLASLTAAVRLWQICQRERFDVVHTHNAMPGILGRLGAALAGIPVVLHTWHSWPMRLRRRLHHRIGFQVLEPLATHAAAAVLFLNPDDQATWSSLRGVDAAKGILVGNGINYDEFVARASSDARERIRREFGIPDDAFVIIKVARLEHPRKGHDFFLEGVRRFRNRDSRRIVALLVGQGDDEGAVRREVAMRGLEQVVRFTGFRRDVADILLASDVSVLVSPFEGIPRALMESMALRIPVIGADVPGTRTLVEAEVSGLLVPFGDADALALALSRLAGDAELRTRLGRAGEARIRSRFNEPIVSARVLEIYRHLLEGQVEALPCWEPEGAVIHASGTPREVANRLA